MGVPYQPVLPCNRQVLKNNGFLIMRQSKIGRMKCRSKRRRYYALDSDRHSYFEGTRQAKGWR